jgi:hypothetical protein
VHVSCFLFVSLRLCLIHFSILFISFCSSSLSPYIFIIFCLHHFTLPFPISHLFFYLFPFFCLTVVIHWSSPVRLWFCTVPADPPPSYRPKYLISTLHHFSAILGFIFHFLFCCFIRSVVWAAWGLVPLRWFYSSTRLKWHFTYLLTPRHYSPDGHKPPLIRFHSLI